MYNDRENIRLHYKKMWLSLPTIHGIENDYISEAIELG